MRVKYGNFRVKGEDMTGKEVEMTEDKARPLIASNIVVETTSVEPSENAMLKRAKPRRRNVIKAKNSTHS